MIQDRESSAVWGMPAAVYNRGCYDICSDLQGLASRLNQKISTADGKIQRKTA